MVGKAASGITAWLSSSPFLVQLSCSNTHSVDFYNYQKQVSIFALVHLVIVHRYFSQK